MTMPDALTAHKREMEDLLARLDVQLDEMKAIASEKRDMLCAHRAYYRELKVWGADRGNA